jgi:hypothetical protein
MADMTREQLQGAVMALEEINVCSFGFHMEPANYIYNAGLAYRAQLAAMPPEPEFSHKAFYVQVDAFEWIAKCKCGWGKRVFNKIDAVLAECDLHDLENNAPTPQPDLREALVEARAALTEVNTIASSCGYALSHFGFDDGSRLRTLSKCLDQQQEIESALARIDKVLEAPRG